MLPTMLARQWLRLHSIHQVSHSVELEILWILGRCGILKMW